MPASFPVLFALSSLTPPSDLMHLPPLPPPDSDARKLAKPPVSPKPVLAQPVPKIQGSPTPASKKVPLPGPSSPGRCRTTAGEGPHTTVSRVFCFLDLMKARGSGVGRYPQTLSSIHPWITPSAQSWDSCGP